LLKPDYLEIDENIYTEYLYGKNDFTEISKNLNIDLKIILFELLK